MNKKVNSEYLRLRKLDTLAKWALSYAKSNIRFDELEADGLVRFTIEPDECYNLEDLLGDCFNPEVNDNIQESKLKREEQQYIDKINQDGVWGITSEVNGETVDSVWGFVGDDWKDSGSDSDVKQAAIDFLAKQYVKEQEHYTTFAM